MVVQRQGNQTSHQSEIGIVFNTLIPVRNDAEKEMKHNELSQCMLYEQIYPSFNQEQTLADSVLYK